MAPPNLTMAGQGSREEVVYLDECPKSCLDCRWFDSVDEWCFEPFTIPGPVCDLRACPSFERKSFLFSEDI